MKIYIINPDKQMNKVVFMFDQVINVIYNSTASKRIDEMPPFPSTSKKIKWKKGTKLSSRMSSPAARTNTFFMFCISIKLKVRGGGAPFLSYKKEKITEIVIVINSMLIVPYPITAGSKVQIECLFTRQTSRAWLMNHFKMSQKPAEKENAKS